MRIGKCRALVSLFKEHQGFEKGQTSRRVLYLDRTSFQKNQSQVDCSERSSIKHASPVDFPGGVRRVKLAMRGLSSDLHTPYMVITGVAETARPSQAYFLVLGAADFEAQRSRESHRYQADA